jgi:hypothetical protein
MSIIEKKINLKNFKGFYSNVMLNDGVKITTGKKTSKNIIQFEKDNPLTYSNIILKGGRLKGYIPSSLNEFTFIPNKEAVLLNVTLTEKKNNEVTKIYSELTKIQKLIKTYKISTKQNIMIVKDGENLKIRLDDKDSIIYFKNCSDISIRSTVPNTLLVITENCSGSLKVFCKKILKNPENKCPENICPKSNDIYYQGALGGVGLILFSLILYNILVKCKNIEED